jgi:hypothetical protein
MSVDALTVIDREDPRGIYNLVPNYVKKAIDQIIPDDLNRSEEELKRLLEPDVFLCQLRYAFWREYNSAQEDYRMMNIASVATMMGVPLHNVTSTLKRPEDLVWVLKPPVSYDLLLEEALNHGIKRLRDDLLNISLFDDEGKFDSKAADIILKTTAFLDMRKNGGIVQKNLHVHANTREMKKFAKDLSVEEIDSKIRELESQRDGTAIEVDSGRD